MSGEIEPRYGAEVYLGKTGKVCIKQAGIFECDDVVVILHPDEAREVARLILATCDEAMLPAEPDEDGV